MNTRLFLISLLLFSFLTATSQSSDLSGAYQGTGYFFHPTASRILNATKSITSVGINKYQLSVADLGGSNFVFQFDLDANNNAVNWVAVGNTPASPASGFMSADNPGGFSFYPGTTTGFVHSVYNNRYDATTKTFYLHYGYQGGTTSESQYQRQIYEKLVRTPQPVITSMSPTSGSYGTMVMVTGRELIGSTPYFSRSTMVDSFYVVSDSVMKIWIGSASTNVSSRLYIGSDSSSSFFSYTPPVVGNTFWNYLGNSGVTTGAVSNVNMSIGTDNTPYVVYVDENGYTVSMKYGSGTWSQLGGTISSGKSNLSNIKVGSNNMAVVAYVDSSNGNGITVKRYDGSSWLTLGSSGFAPNKLSSTLSLSLDSSNNPYVLSSDIVGSSMTLSVYKYNGSSWLNLGVVASGVNDYATMDVDKITNTPYVVYSKVSNYQASVRKRIDTSWVSVGIADFTDAPRGIYYPVIRVDKLGVPHVMLQDDDIHERLSMYSFVGGVWTRGSSMKFSKSHSYAPSLTFDRNNRAVVAFTDASYNNNGSVMHMLSDGSWEYKGDRGFEPAINQLGAVQADNLDYHLIAFSDRSNGGKLSVMKYTATIYSSYSTTSCDSLVLPWSTVVFSSGDYTFSYQTNNGRDSVVTAHVIINHSTSSVTNYAACGSTLPYYWNGKAYSTAGTYTANLTNANGCDSTAVLVLTISGVTPGAPTAVTQTLVSNVCGQRVYRYAVTAVANATGYAWTLPTSVGGVSGVTVDSGDATRDRVIRLMYASNAAALTTDSIKVRAWSGCGSSATKGFKLTNAVLAVPAAPTAVTIAAIAPSVCGAKLYRYSAPNLTTGSATIAPATGWVWSFSGTLGDNAVIDSGDVNSQKIVVSFTSNAAAGAGDSVKVAYLSLCGNSATKAAKLTNVVTTAPLVPASITIQAVTTNVCGNRVYRYIAPALPVATATAAAATEYVWSFVGTLGANATIDSGDVNSQKVVVRYTLNSAAGTGDSVKLYYTSSCGSSPVKASKLSNAAITPPLAPTAITITAVAPSVCGAKVYRYAAPALPIATATATAATGWLWSFTGTLGANATIDSGDVNSRVIRVSFTSNAAAGTGDSVRVAYLSDCGNSANKASKLTNVVTTVPAAPTAIGITALQTNVCGARRYRYAAPAVVPVATATAAGVTGWLWSFTGTLGANATIDSGNVNSKIITVTFTSNAAAGSTDSVRLQYTSSCGNSLPVRAKLTNTALVTPTPATAPTIQVVSDVCGDRRYRYSAANLPVATATAPAATGWLWSFTGTLGANAVIDSGDATSQKIVVRYTVYTAAAAGDSVRVAFTSGCGTSASKSTKLSNLAKTCVTPANIPVSKAVTTPAESMSVKVFPNPTTSNFNLQVITAGSEAITARVLDMQGRFIKSVVIAPNRTVNIGIDLKAGTYFIEVRQGKEVKTTKLIKF